MLSRAFFIVMGYLILTFSLSANPHASLTNKEGHKFISVEKHQEWEVFILKEQDIPVCWVSTDSISDDKKEYRNKSTLFTSFIPSEKIRDSVSVYLQEGDKTLQNIVAKIDDIIPFPFIAKEKWAWPSDNLTESRFIVASENGNNVIFHYQDSNKKEHRKKFSLSGYSKAYNTMIKTCMPFFKK